MSSTSTSARSRRSGSTSRAHDVRFVEDDWEGPTLGAWGLGWEVWMDGREITQFTYFQQVGGLDLDAIPAEITYGLERIAMFLQGKRSAFELQWTKDMTWGDVYRENERQWSVYNFELAPVDVLMNRFGEHERRVPDAHRGGAADPGVRPRPQGLARVQPPRRARRDLRHRARRLHRARPQPRPRGRPALRRPAAGARRGGRDADAPA